MVDRPVFVAYVTAGFPEPSDTVPALLGLQAGGADVIELGMREVCTAYTIAHQTL